MAAPAQVLSLLPPAPAAGWPDEFMLHRVVLQLRSQAKARRAQTTFRGDDSEPYVPCAESYPVRRRVQRLSFIIWAVLGQDNEDLLRALETTSTRDRMRLALLRLRELRGDL